MGIAKPRPMLPLELSELVLIAVFSYVIAARRFPYAKTAPSSFSTQHRHAQTKRCTSFTCSPFIDAQVLWLLKMGYRIFLPLRHELLLLLLVLLLLVLLLLLLLLNHVDD